MKKLILPVIVIFFNWAILDFVLHGLILGSTYAALPQIFRPMAEMKMALIYLMTFIISFVFVHVYVNYVSAKSMRRALGYSAWLGLAYGVSMGYGTYSSIPIPYSMALTWFLGTFVEMLAAGVILGMMVKPSAS